MTMMTMDESNKLAAAAPGILSDDAMLPTEMAALYLRLSPAEFADAQKSKRVDGRGQPSPPAMGKFDKGAKTQNLPTAFRLGSLRESNPKPTSASAPEAASKAGLSGWMNAKIPFFAELEPRVKRGRRVLIGSAWDLADPLREARFADLLAGRIRFTWVTSTEAAASLWSDAASHRAFAARGLALLEAEAQGIEASIAASQRLADDAAPATG